MIKPERPDLNVVPQSIRGNYPRDKQHQPGASLWFPALLLLMGIVLFAFMVWSIYR